MHLRLISMFTCVWHNDIHCVSNVCTIPSTYKKQLHAVSKRSSQSRSFSFYAYYGNRNWERKNVFQTKKVWYFNFYIRSPSNHQTKCISRPSKVIKDYFNLGIFPHFLETGLVVPTSKSGDKSKIGNSWLITVVPILSNIYERVVLNQLCQWSDAFNLLSCCQFGFRKKLSTSDAIVNCFLKPLVVLTMLLYSKILAYI